LKLLTDLYHTKKFADRSL